MRVLVTGGAGFLGSHLVDALVERGDEVIVFDNFRRGHWRNLDGHLVARRITVSTGDVRQYEAVLKAASGCEVVYHLAAQSNVMGGVRDTEYTFATNVIGTSNVLKATSERGVRRVIFASSREVYGEPDAIPVPECAPLRAKNAYGVSKVVGEACCRFWQGVHGLDCLVLRLVNVYGPRDMGRVIPLWLQRARRGEDLVLFGGQQVLDFLWIGVAVQALIASAECPNDGPVNIGSGRGVALARLAERILALTRSTSVVGRCPARDPEVVRFVADVSRMRQVLGVEPPEDPLSHLTDLAM